MIVKSEVVLLPGIGSSGPCDHHPRGRVLLVVFKGLYYTDASVTSPSNFLPAARM